MTHAQIKALFENIVDDKLDDAFAYDLLNMAADAIAMEFEFEIFKKISSALTAASGDTYLTAKALPSDFLAPIGGKLWLEGDSQPLEQVRFEDREAWRPGGRRWYIDYRGGNFYLIHKVGSTTTLHLPYFGKPTDASVDTAGSSPPGPNTFHRLIAIDMATFYFAGLEGDDAARSLSQEQKNERAILRRALKVWDAGLKLSAMGGRASRPGPSAVNRPDAVDLS